MQNNISFLSLNIGNPSIERARKQCEWLEKRTEDVFILTETKYSQGCSYIEEFFSQYGYDLFSMNSNINYSINFPKSLTGDLGVMIVSKFPIRSNLSYFPNDNIFYAREAESIISCNDKNINVVGLYVPSRDRSDEKIYRKRNFINGIESMLGNLVNNFKIIMGDLNILDKDHVPHYSTFFNWEYDFYDKIINFGFTDAYKLCNPQGRDYSWVGRTNDGYRYDYCFVSNDLKENIINCSYIHETRKSKITDHSAITIELKV